MLTSDAAIAWGAANNVTSLSVASRLRSQGTFYAKIFIFHGEHVSGDVHLQTRELREDRGPSVDTQIRPLMDT